LKITIPSSIIIPGVRWISIIGPVAWGSIWWMPPYPHLSITQMLDQKPNVFALTTVQACETVLSG